MDLGATLAFASCLTHKDAALTLNVYHCIRIFPESVCEGLTSAELRLIYIFTSSPLHIYIVTYISAHLHIYIHILTSTSHLNICSSSHLQSHLHIYIFTSSHLHLCSSSSSHIYISAQLHILTSTSHIFTSRTSLLSLSRPGARPPEHHETQPSAEIVCVEGAKCRREYVLARSGATLCGDRACRPCSTTLARGAICGTGS